MGEYESRPQFQRGCLILKTRKPASFWMDTILITDVDGVTPTSVSLTDASLVCEESLSECQVRDIGTQSLQMQ